MTRAAWLAVAWLAVAGVVSGQTTTTRTDRVIATTSIVVGGTSFTTTTASFPGTVTATSGLVTLGATIFGSATGLPASIGAGGPVLANGGGSPVSGRLFVGDGSGWELLVASRTGSATTDRVSITDTGTIRPATGYTGSLGQASRKWLTIYGAELWVSSLVAQQTIASIGGRILVGNTTQLANPLGTGDAAIYLKHNSFSNGDLLVLESNGQFEVVQLTSTCYAPCTTAPFVYNITHNVDGSGANSWQAGDAAFSIQSNWIDLYSVAGLNAASALGPTIVGQVRNSSTWNDWSPRWAMGRLDQLYGYTSTSCGGAPCYGVGLGKWESNVVTVDPSNGIRMLYNGAVLGQWSGSTLTLGQPLTSNNSGQIQIDSSSIKIRWRDNAGATADLLTIANSGGAGYATLAGSLQVNGTLIVASPITDGTGDLSINASDTGASIVLNASSAGGTVRPNTDTANSLGTSTKRWGNVYAAIATTTTDYNPIVVNATTGQFLEKTDGVSATFNPTTCSSMTFHSGLLVAKVGC